ncbi:MAG TPA: cysteine desulfurase family protein [bacterium]|nr:cysteine desulfurase family protein [bacterium]
MIYLDYSATTPLDPKVLKVMLPFFSKDFANPASVHTPGQTALKAVDDARYSIAKILGVSGQEIIFTSGATEANNLALKGIIESSSLRKKHIITTSIEHDSILEPCAYLEKRGVNVTYVPVDNQGLVNPENIIKAIRPETILVSIGYVNSETGSIQPIKKIGRLLKNYNEKNYKLWLNTSPRKRGPKPQPIYFHTDATQAPNFLNCQPEVLHVDLMSLSSHKVYGPKGIGLLYIRSGVPINSLVQGGHQERNLRSGTVHVPGVVGFAEALILAIKNQSTAYKKIRKLRDQLCNTLQKKLPQIIINTPLTNSAPSHLNISFPGLEGDIIQALLDEKGLAVSTGSACASGDITTSHVLMAMTHDEKISQGALRLTLGKLTTRKEITKSSLIISKVIKKLSLSLKS